VTVVLDTSSSRPERRLAVWQDIVCDTFVGLDCKSDMRGAFWGAVSQSRIGPMAFTQVDSTAQRVFRTPSRIARASEDYVLMALGNHGVNGVFQDGREAIVSAGQFVIYDTTRPYELRFDDSFSQTIFQMPRKLLQQRVGSFDGLTATTFAGDRPLERLTYDFARNVSRTIELVDPAAASRLLDQALDLLAMTLADRLHARLPDQSVHHSALLYRLKNHILTHLADPELSLPRAAAATGISPRYASDLMAVSRLRADATAGALQARPGRSRQPGPAYRRDCLRVGLQRPRPFQPYLQAAVRRLAARMARAAAPITHSTPSCHTTGIRRPSAS
jgi:AraC-binding-like domain